MTSVALLADDVRRAVEEMPYTVVDETAEGFSVHLDVVDARWWGLLSRSGVKQTWRWDVHVRPDGTYTLTDAPGSLSWQAGLLGPGGEPRPRLAFQASAFRGTARTISFRKTWALGDDGRFEKVVDYTFDSDEGRRIIDAVATRHGLEKKMNGPAKIGLFFAVLALGSLLVGGVVVLVLALTGNLG